MFKLLKKLFEAGEEVNNNPFFDEVGNPAPSAPIVETHNPEIPVESLAQFIRMKEDADIYVMSGYYRAHLKIPSGENLVYINIAICDSKHNNRRVWLSKKVGMTTYQKVEGSDRHCEISDEKEFELTDVEANYLSKVIYTRNAEDEAKKQHNARQEMEDVLQSALNKQGGFPSLEETS